MIFISFPLGYGLCIKNWKPEISSIDPVKYLYAYLPMPKMWKQLIIITIMFKAQSNYVKGMFKKFWILIPCILNKS